MTETPGADGPPQDEGPSSEQAPAWAEPEPPASDDDQYDAWLTAEDELRGEPADEAAPEPAEPADEAAPDLPDEPAAGPGNEPVPEPDAPVEADAPGDEEPRGSAETAALDVRAGEEGEATGEAADEADPVEAPEPTGAEVPPLDVEDPPAEEPREAPAPEAAAPAEAAGLEAAEPAAPDPSPAVAAAPVVDPVGVDVAAPAQPSDRGEALGGDEDALVPAFRSATALLASLAAAVVLLASLTAFLAVRSVSTRDGGAAEDDRREALAASRAAARVVFSYDYRHTAKDFAAGKAVSTASFLQEYQRTTGKLGEIAAKYKAVVVADISDAAVVCRGQVVSTEPKDAADRDAKPPSCVSHQSSEEKDAGYRREQGVVTLLFLTQQSTSTLNSGSKITQSRLEMTMVRRHGRWLVARIRAF